MGNKVEGDAVLLIFLTGEIGAIIAEVAFQVAAQPLLYLIFYRYFSPPEFIFPFAAHDACLGIGIGYIRDLRVSGYLARKRMFQGEFYARGGIGWTILSPLLVGERGLGNAAEAFKAKISIAAGAVIEVRFYPKPGHIIPYILFIHKG